MSDQAVYDVCLDLFDGIFEVAREQKIPYQQMRESNENFVELFAILRRFIQSNLTGVTQIRKNEKLIEWSSSPVLIAIVKYKELSCLEILIRGGYRKCLMYFLSHNQVDPTLPLIHSPLSSEHCCSASDRIFIMYELKQNESFTKQNINDLLRQKHYDYLLELMKQWDKNELFCRSIYENFERWSELIDVYKNTNKFDFRRFFYNIFFARTIFIEHGELYIIIVRHCINIFGLDFVRQKIINNIACEPEQFDNEWSFLYNRFGISLSDALVLRTIGELIGIDIHIGVDG